MEIKLSFLGAAQNVTGSRYLLETNGTRLLIDCGLYQERKLKERNWDPFPVPPGSINAVLLTHAHLDHCGLLPKLVREGFQGKIYCTPATAEISEIVLLDSARLQEEDAEFKRQRHEREGRTGPYPEIPLYTTGDAKNSLPHFSPVEYAQPAQVASGIQATFHDAGHILGSSMIKINLSQNGEERSILFSGDVGRWGRPILRDPTLFDSADYVLVESTYGDRLHNNGSSIDDTLADHIDSARQNGGNIVIPSFAIERSQEVLYHMNKLLIDDRIPHLMVFIDSPMATSVTEVFKHHPELFDEEMSQLISQGESPFAFPGLKMTSSVEESKAINHITGTVIVIAGSGMCTGGRIKHHLVNNISRPESTILFVGYQAIGTLGRQIVDGAQEVRILGEPRPVKAKIAQLSGFSAHADKNELFRWLSSLQRPPRHLFITHGEPDAGQSFADFLREKTHWQVSMPAYRDELVLN